MRRLFVPILLAVGLTACAGANWNARERASAYSAPKRVQMVIQVEQNVNNDDLKEALQTFETALVEKLKDRGIDAKRAAGGEGGNVKFDVTRWDPGSRAGRAFVGAFGVGKAEIEVNVLVAAADGKTQLNGVAVGYVRSGFFGGSATSAAEEAAGKIADAIAGYSTN